LNKSFLLYTFLAKTAFFGNLIPLDMENDGFPIKIALQIAPLRGELKKSAYFQINLIGFGRRKQKSYTKNMIV